MKLFNTSDLFTGYIKQLLHNFNLPKVKVYTKKHRQYAEINGRESAEILGTFKYNSNNTDSTLSIRYFPYIKDGEFQEYINGNWQNIGKSVKSAPKYYSYNEKVLNYTKTLKIDSNVYDSYTHEYLGDYLRFQRDYSSLNLMPLYNCFSDRACDKLNIKIGQDIKFNTADTNYKIYMLPVKLFQEYTIAIDSNTPIELCCGIYGDYQDTREKFNCISQYTYKKIAVSNFGKPFIYDALTYTNDNTQNTLLEYLDSLNDEAKTKIEIAQNECDLKLFIKIPANNTSTIVVLEGNYLDWNSSIWQPGDPKRTNKTVINLDSKAIYTDLTLKTPLQLLQFNTNKQHPFADRLIEYLIGNAITNTEDEVYDNIRRAQKAIVDNENSSYVLKYPGVWTDEMNKVFYEYMTNKVTDFKTNHDILGYVDKDVEKYYKARIKDITNTPSYISLSNIELEEGDK